MADNIANLVDYDLTGSRADYYPTLVRPELERYIDNVDLTIAGPPCEGNSNFNNHTRRRDKRNELYVASVAIAIAMHSKVIIVENVASVVNAREKVVGRALDMLRASGYKIDVNEIVLDASNHGVAQRRKRHFLVAGRDQSLANVSQQGLMFSPLSAMDVISDLIGREGESPLDEPSELSKANQRRIHHLVDHDRFDLPTSERPDCHRLKSHSYVSVYGRMYPDQPSQTVTGGFLTPGRGRYVHPVARRGLTLREGARLQGFPDDYKWYRKGAEVQRNSLARLIGDAVPPQLGYTVVSGQTGTLYSPVRLS